MSTFIDIARANPEISATIKHLERLVTLNETFCSTAEDYKCKVNRVMDEYLHRIVDAHRKATEEISEFLHSNHYDCLPGLKEIADFCAKWNLQEDSVLANAIIEIIEEAQSIDTKDYLSFVDLNNDNIRIHYRDLYNRLSKLESKICSFLDNFREP